MKGMGGITYKAETSIGLGWFDYCGYIRRCRIGVASIWAGCDYIKWMMRKLHAKLGP